MEWIYGVQCCRGELPPVSRRLYFQILLNPLKYWYKPRGWSFARVIFVNSILDNSHDYCVLGIRQCSGGPGQGDIQGHPLHLLHYQFVHPPNRVYFQVANLHWWLTATVAERTCHLLHRHLN